MNPVASLRASRDQLLRLRTDQAAAVREFTWPDVGPRFNWAIDWFDGFARANANTGLTILEEDGTSVARTFVELSQNSDRIALWLRSLGVAVGDAVILMLGNQVELWEVMLAVMKLGAVIVPTTPAVGSADLAERLERANARHVICNVADVGKFESVPGAYTRVSVGAAPGWSDLAESNQVESEPIEHPGTSPADPLLLYFTSGTTSRPKLAEHTQTSYPIGHLSTMYWLGVQPGDVHMNISSPGWAKHAWSCFFAPWLAEAHIVVPNYRRFDPAVLLEQLRQAEVSTFCAPPTVWRMLIQAELGPRPASLREVVSAGEPLNPEVIYHVREAWGLTIRDGYGQTETTAQIGNAPGSEVQPGSMGRPLPGVPVLLVDVVSGEVIDGRGEGEICLETSALPLMSGYQDDPERHTAVAQGLYHTGDIATRDEAGLFTFVGRTDDVFKASDYKISPFELESVLVEHPAVVEAAVVPASDPLRLAVPKAYVAVAADYARNADTALSILRHARERLAPYQRIRRLEFAELPKTISGKIRRVELRALEQEREAQGSPTAEWRDDQFPELKS